jgi:hypothetical protein
MQGPSSTGCIHGFRSVLTNRACRPVPIKLPRYEFEVSGNMTHLPRSGYISKPRVASTLGKQVSIIINPERVAPVGATALRLNRFISATQGSRSGDPGL